MGSIPQLGYTYIQLFGHVTEDDYPYTSGTTTDTGDCMYDFMNTAPVVGITGYNTMAPNDQEAVMTHWRTSIKSLSKASSGREIQPTDLKSRNQTLLLMMTAKMLTTFLTSLLIYSKSF